MLYAMRNPAECGLKVDGVTTRDLAGFVHDRRDRYTDDRHE